MKRETGASPVRSRHCKHEPNPARPLAKAGKAEEAMTASQETCLNSA